MLMLLPGPDSYINIHTHRKPLLAQEWALRNGYHQLSETQLHTMPYPVSMGVHPWFTGSGTAAKFYENATDLLCQSSVMAIGETGLDKVKGPSLDIQKYHFEKHTALAADCAKPIIVHCVKSLGDLWPYFKKNREIAFIVHGFRGNGQQAKELVALGNVWCSFGAVLFHETAKEIPALLQLPTGSFFLETDTANIGIDKVYERCAVIRKTSVEKLQNELFYTFAQVFGKG